MNNNLMGPWRVDPECNCDVQTADGKFEIATTHPNILSGGDTVSEAAQTFARAISAVPELIAFAEDVRSVLSDLLCDEAPGTGDPNDDPLVDLLRRAAEVVAKAIGE